MCVCGLSSSLSCCENCSGFHIVFALITLQLIHGKLTLRCRKELQVQSVEHFDLIYRTKFLNASSYQKIKSKRQRKTPTRKKNDPNWLTLMLRHLATESCTLRRSVCVVWRKMVKCHVNMLSQDVCMPLPGWQSFVTAW